MFLYNAISKGKYKDDDKCVIMNNRLYGGHVAIRLLVAEKFLHSRTKMRESSRSRIPRKDPEY